MGPTWVLSALGGPLVCPMNLAIRGFTVFYRINAFFYRTVNNGVNFIEYRITGSPLRHPHSTEGWLLPHDNARNGNLYALQALCSGNPPVTGGCPAQRAIDADHRFLCHQSGETFAQTVGNETPQRLCDVTLKWHYLSEGWWHYATIPGHNRLRLWLGSLALINNTIKSHFLNQCCLVLDKTTRRKFYWHPRDQHTFSFMENFSIQDFFNFVQPKYTRCFFYVTPPAV